MSALKLEPLGRTLARRLPMPDAPADRLTENSRVPLEPPAGVSALKLEPLGRTPAASTISYLDSGVVFVGSAFGDSQLIRWVLLLLCRA